MRRVGSNRLAARFSRTDAEEAPGYALEIVSKILARQIDESERYERGAAEYAATASRAHPVGWCGLTTGGVPRPTMTLASSRYVVAIALPSVPLFSHHWRVAGSTARIVPVRTARSGMMLVAVPALTVPTVTTPGVAGLSRRATIVWSAPISAPAPTTGSADSCGRAACAPRPINSIENVSADAASDPSSATTWPTPNRRSTWPPKMAETPLSARAEHVQSPAADLLRRLQHDQHIAQCWSSSEQRRGADRPRRVHIVTARMHDPRHLRRIGQTGRLLDGECIDIPAHRDNRAAGAAATNASDHGGTAESHIGGR